jgi:hypothetical protein
MDLSIVLAGWLALGGPALLAAGDGTFQAPQWILLVEAPVSLTTGNFSQGGLPGIAVVHATSRVSVLLREGPRVWKEKPSLTVGNGCFYIRAADFDGDGLDDLAIADPGSTAYTLRCLGGGAFGNPVALHQAEGPRATVIGDYNGDGVLDIVTVNHPKESVSVFLGKGDGTFTHFKTVQAGVEEHNHDLACLDYDGDGKLDLVLAVDFQGLQLLNGAGDGNFAPKPMSQTVASSGYFVTGANLNNDNFGDVMAIDNMAPNPTGMYTAVTGTSRGDGTFKMGVSISDVACLPGLGDMDSDGNMDIIATFMGKGSIEIHRGKGDGTFQAPLSFDGSLMNSTQVLPADIDMDGNLDLLIPSGQGSILAIQGKGKDGLDLPPSLTGFGPAKAMAIADVNRDGFPDILTAAIKARIDVFLQPGKRSQAETTPSYSISTTNLFSTLETADMDGNGTVDLVGTNVVSGAAVVVLLDGDHKVLKETLFPVGNLPGPVAVGRVDADDTLDMAVPCPSPNHVAVFLGIGGGDFGSPVKVTTISKARKIALVDLDTDGRSDIAVMSTTAVAVHWASSPGAFDPPASVLSKAGANLVDIAVGDVNGDSLPDIAVVDSNNWTSTIVKGKGARSFEAPKTLSLAEAGRSISLADLDGDGLQELVVTLPGSRSALVFLNQEGQGFGKGVPYLVGVEALAHRLADLDLDGTLDLVTFAALKATILFGNVGSSRDFRRGDADADGVPKITDAICILQRLFLGGEPLPCEDASDANDDGKLNITDPITLLLHLFVGGGPLPAPGDCGPDPTPDALGCASDCGGA